MTAAGRKSREDQGVITEADVIGDEECWAGESFHVFASGNRHAAHDASDRENDRVEEQYAYQLNEGPAWPGGIRIRDCALFDFTGYELLHVADCGGGGKGCFVEGDLVAIFEGAE